MKEARKLLWLLFACGVLAGLAIPRAAQAQEVWKLIGPSGWTGTMTQRGTSNTYDDVWEKLGSGRVTGVVEITAGPAVSNRVGNAIRFRHVSRSDGTSCEFSGVFQTATTVKGTYTCSSTGSSVWDWSATIQGPGTTTTTGAPTVRTQKQVYSPNEPIVAEFSGFPGKEDAGYVGMADVGWITMCYAGAEASRNCSPRSTGRERSGSVTYSLGLPAGSYEVRGFVGWPLSETNLVARYPFTVAGGAVTPPTPPPPPPPPPTPAAGGTSPPYAPTLVSPGNTYQPPLASTGGLTLIWRNNGDPDGDQVGSWVNLFRTQYGQNGWTDWQLVYQGWGQGDRLDIGSSQGLIPGACYAWRVFAVDLGYRSNPYYAESGWSVFCAQSEGGDIDIYIE